MGGVGARALLAAPQPLLLLIDDLQWCDQETLAWLRYLLRFDPQARVLILGTARAEEIDDAHPLATLLRHLRNTDQVTEIELRPLDAEQTAILAAQTAQQALTPALQQTLYRATAGNPLFVVETVRAGLNNQRLEIGDQATVSNLQSRISKRFPPKFKPSFSTAWPSFRQRRATWLTWPPSLGKLSRSIYWFKPAANMRMRS